MLEGKPALGIVNLHGGHAQIRQHKIELLPLRQNLIRVRKIHPQHRQNFRAVAQPRQTLPGLFRFDGVHVRGVEMAAPLQTLQHLLGVSAVAQRGIQPNLSRLNLQKIQNLPHANGEVHSGRGFPALDNLLHILPVLFRIQFLILLLKAAGMCSLVADAPLMLGLLFHRLSSLLRANSAFLFCHHTTKIRKIEVRIPGTASVKKTRKKFYRNLCTLAENLI
jgi:hypothetical protein